MYLYLNTLHNFHMKAYQLFLNLLKPTKELRKSFCFKHYVLVTKIYEVIDSSPSHFVRFAYDLPSNS